MVLTYLINSVFGRFPGQGGDHFAPAPAPFPHLYPRPRPAPASLSAAAADQTSPGKKRGCDDLPLGGLYIGAVELVTDQVDGLPRVTEEGDELVTDHVDGLPSVTEEGDELVTDQIEGLPPVTEGGDEEPEQGRANQLFRSLRAYGGRGLLCVGLGFILAGAMPWNRKTINMRTFHKGHI